MFFSFKLFASKAFSSHLVPRACFRNCLNFKVVNHLKKLPHRPNFGLNLLFGANLVNFS